jgi:hypothetical protein
MGNPLERRRLFKADPNGTGDPEDEADPLLVGEAPPEDNPPGHVIGPIRSFSRPTLDNI